MIKVTILHRGTRYDADWIDGPHGGLCITRKRPGKNQSNGIIVSLGQSAFDWREALESENDADIREALCKAAFP